MKTKTIMAIVIVMILILAAAFVFTLNPQKTDNLPGFATSKKIQEAYMFAKNSPELLDSINCFCGCMQHLHDGRIHKRGLLDCFMKEDGSYERHASECDMCINDALEVKALSEQGLSKESIKEKMHSKYQG